MRMEIWKTYITIEQLNVKNQVSDFVVALEKLEIALSFLFKTFVKIT